MTELGRRLRPQRERRWIIRAMHHPQCPGRTDDGRYEVAPWQKFIDEHGDAIGHLDEKIKRGEPTGLEKQLKEARLRAEIADAEARERANRREAGRDIEKDKAVREVAALFGVVKERLLRLPPQVAPTIVASRDIPAAELLLRTELLQALEELTIDNVACLQGPTDAAESAAR